MLFKFQFPDVYYYMNPIEFYILSLGAATMQITHPFFLLFCSFIVFST